MAELPQGTVTLGFTDIEGSTRLLTALGSRYEAVLADHRRLLRNAFSFHAGIEVDTQGDALFYAFAKAHDAVTAAVGRPSKRRQMAATSAALSWVRAKSCLTARARSVNRATAAQLGFHGLVVDAQTLRSATAADPQI